MDSIAVTKPDMAVAKRDRLGLSLFGLLSLAFGDEVRARSAWQTGLYREEPLTLLEESEPVPAAVSERELHLDVDLKVVLETLRQERQQAGKRQTQAVERILERVYLIEQRIRETALAQSQVDVRFEMLREQPRAERHAADPLLPARERSLLAAVQAAADNMRQRKTARSKGKTPDTVRAGGLPADGKLCCVPIGTQAAAAVRQMRRAAANRMRQNGQHGTAKPLVIPLAPVSWSTAVPDAGGWTPHWQEESLGFLSPKRGKGAEKGLLTGGSILLPDQLRLRRQCALEQAETEAFLTGRPASKQMPPHPHAVPQDSAVWRPLHQEEHGAEGGTGVPRTSRSSEVPLHHPEEQERTAAFGKNEGEAVQSSTASGEIQTAAVFEKTEAAADSARAADRMDRSAARTERLDTASLQNGSLRRPADSPIAAKTILPGAELPQEALLYRAERQETLSFSREADSRRSVRKQEEAHQTAASAAQRALEPDMMSPADAELRTGRRATAPAARVTVRSAEIQRGEAQLPSAADFPEQDGALGARPAQRASDAVTGQESFFAEPLLYQTGAAESENPSLRSGWQTAKQKDKSSAFFEQPARPESPGARSEQTAHNGLRPAPISEIEAVDPLIWREERARTKREAAAADERRTGDAPGFAGGATGWIDRTASPHTVLTEAAALFFPTLDKRRQAEKQGALQPVIGGTGRIPQTAMDLVHRAGRETASVVVQERPAGRTAQAAPHGTAAEGRGRREEQPHTALRRVDSRRAVHAIQPAPTALLRPLHADRIAAVRPLSALSYGTSQPQNTSVQSTAEEDTLSYLPLQAAKQQTGRETPSQTGALPEWAQRFLQQSHTDSRSTHRFSAAQQAAGERQGQIEWTAPGGALPKDMPVVFRERQQAETQRTAAPARLSDSELRRAADKVYRIIEERLRRELRRGGK